MLSRYLREMVLLGRNDFQRRVRMVVHLRQAHHQLERIASFCGHDHRLPLSFAPGISENSLTYCFQYFPVCPYYTPTNLVCQWDEMQVYKFFTENFHDMGCGFLGEYDDKKRTVLRTVRFFQKLFPVIPSTEVFPLSASFAPMHHPVVSAADRTQPCP